MPEPLHGPMTAWNQSTQTSCESSISASTVGIGRNMPVISCNLSSVTLTHFDIFKCHCCLAMGGMLQRPTRPVELPHRFTARSRPLLTIAQFGAAETLFRSVSCVIGHQVSGLPCSLHQVNLALKAVELTAATHLGDCLRVVS